MHGDVERTWVTVEGVLEDSEERDERRSEEQPLCLAKVFFDGRLDAIKPYLALERKA